MLNFQQASPPFPLKKYKKKNSFYIYKRTLFICHKEQKKIMGGRKTPPGVLEEERGLCLKVVKMEILGGFREKKAIFGGGGWGGVHEQLPRFKKNTKNPKTCKKNPQKNLPKSWKMAPKNTPLPAPEKEKKSARWGWRNLGNFGNFRGISRPGNLYIKIAKKK